MPLKLIKSKGNLFYIIITLNTHDINYDDLIFDYTMYLMKECAYF